MRAAQRNLNVKSFRSEVKEVKVMMLQGKAVLMSNCAIKIKIVSHSFVLGLPVRNSIWRLKLVI